AVAAAIAATVAAMAAVASAKEPVAPAAVAVAVAPIAAVAAAIVAAVAPAIGIAIAAPVAAVAPGKGCTLRSRRHRNHQHQAVHCRDLLCWSWLRSRKRNVLSCLVPSEAGGNGSKMHTIIDPKACR